METPLESDLLRRMDAYWRAANFLSVGQIYLYDNPLLREPLKLSHVKPMLLGHWGTTPGQNFIYAHLNRVSSTSSISPATARTCRRSGTGSGATQNECTRVSRHRARPPRNCFGA